MVLAERFHCAKERAMGRRFLCTSRPIHQNESEKQNHRLVPFEMTGNGGRASETRRLKSVPLGRAGGRVRGFFEGLAVPMRELGAGFVSGLAEIEERGRGR